MDPLVEQLEDLFAGSAGARPYEVAVDAAGDLALDRYSRQQPPADVAVRDGADHTPFGVTGKQDPEHVGIEPLECLLDRVALGDGKVTLSGNVAGPKRQPVPVLARKRLYFRVVRYGRGADRARLPMARRIPADMALHEDGLTCLAACTVFHG